MVLTRKIARVYAKRLFLQAELTHDEAEKTLLIMRAIAYELWTPRNAQWDKAVNAFMRENEAL